MPTRVASLTLTGFCLLLVGAVAADRTAGQTRKLVAVLESDAALFDKARACQQLGEFGDAQAVPALAALLADEHLSAYARSGLEGIPDPAASAALRSAAGVLEGDLLSGVIDSLGVLRDAQAVDLLKRLAEDSASGAAGAALRALGCIATDQAIEVVRRALARAPETLRPEVASACLLAAERQLTDGHLDTAVALYDTLRRATAASVYLAAATRGAIVARKADGVPLLIETLRSEDRTLRHAALTAIREIPSDTLATALNAELERAPAELEIQLLTALADCHNAQSLAVLAAKARSADPKVRRAALGVLGRIGGASEAGVLLEAVASNRSAQESTLALNGLRRLAGSPIDARIIAALAATPAGTARIQFIRLLGDRAATSATGELLKQAADPDPEVGVAALRALRSLASSDELTAMIRLVESSQNVAVREAAESAVVGTCTRTGSAATGSEAVLAKLSRATDPALKDSWIGILTSLGQSQTLPAVLAATRDANESVAANAIAQLARWPDPAPVDDLFRMVESEANPVRRQRALASAIRLATIAAEERQRPQATLAQWFEQADHAAQTTAERRLIISGLGRLPHLDSLRLLKPYLDDPALRNEAAAAVLQIAPALGTEEPASVKAALERVTTTTTRPDLRDRAIEIAASISP